LGGHEDAPGDGGRVGVHLGDPCPLLRGRTAGFGGEFCGGGEQCLACALLPVAPSQLGGGGHAGRKQQGVDAHHRLGRTAGQPGVGESSLAEAGLAGHPGLVGPAPGGGQRCFGGVDADEAGAGCRGHPQARATVAAAGINQALAGCCVQLVGELAQFGHADVAERVGPGGVLRPVYLLPDARLHCRGKAGEGLLESRPAVHCS